MTLLRKKVLSGLVTLAILVAGAYFALGATARMQVGYAQSSRVVNTTDVYLPSGSDPWGTASDSSGRVWVAAPGCDPSPTCSSSTPPGKLVVYDPATARWVNTYQLPAGFAQPLFLAFDQQGRLWFPMPMGNSIGMFNPTNKTFQQWIIPTSGVGPWGVAIDSKGRVWFTEHYSNKIGYFDPVGQTFTEIATPASNSQPYGIVVDASDNVWFTENNSSVALIGEYTAQGTLQEYKVRNSPPSGLTPHLITVDASGNIWWSEGWVGMIGELRVVSATPGTTNGVTEYAYQHLCNNCSTHTSGISADSYGNIWFDDSLQNTFGSFPDSGTGAFSVYNVPTSNSHPHDGMHVDAQNRVWFDEEFANKLALATQSTVSTPSPIATTSLTPSPTVAISPTPSPSPTMSPTPGATLAQDAFQRANQSLWGTASDGHTWAGDANSASVFSISGNTGHIASGSTSYSAVLGPTASNADALLSGSISSFNNTNIGAVLRWTDGNNWYKAYINGTSLIIQKKVNGTTTILGNVAFAATAGTSYTLRFRVVGTTLTAKVWATNSAEPGNWMVTSTDSTFQSGYCGLRMLVQGGAVAAFTAFTATSA